MTISDIIEQFLLETLGSELSVNFNRNELAQYFSVSPSQINYVLATRFTPERGFLVESRRGGGGSVKLIKVTAEIEDTLLKYIEETLSEGIDYIKACQIVDRLVSEELYTANEGRLIKSALSDKALLAPTVIKNKLRGAVLKNVLIETLKMMGESDADDSKDVGDAE